MFGVACSLFRVLTEISSAPATAVMNGMQVTSALPATLMAVPTTMATAASTTTANNVPGLTKTSVGFLENLNSKLAEQRLSGKAYAVRNLINSKALVMTWERQVQWGVHSEQEFEHV